MQQEHTWQMPTWWCRERKPQNDTVYFENMSRVIFEAGLNWHVIDEKWPATKKAFANFEVNRVAAFTNADVQRLLNDTGIVRNKSKIEGIIKNAKRFQVIEKVFGGFRGYLDSLDKSNNYAAAVKDLTSKFERLGPSSASLYLYTVGEDIKPW
jgi:3-methyladenine DNA glycosylase Tag